MQRLPSAVSIDTLQESLTFIGKVRQAQHFEALWRQSATAQPALLAWLSRRPVQALELADCWDRLLDVIAWLQAHPRPAVYLRQVDVSGVDCEFIEAHRGVLAELLNLALLPENIEPDASGVAQFTRRFGFLDKPVRVRFRLLDAPLARYVTPTSTPTERSSCWHPPRRHMLRSQKTNDSLPCRSRRRTASGS